MNDLIQRLRAEAVERRHDASKHGELAVVKIRRAARRAECYGDDGSVDAKAATYYANLALDLEQAADALDRLSADVCPRHIWADFGYARRCVSCGVWEDRNAPEVP